MRSKKPLTIQEQQTLVNFLKSLEITSLNPYALRALSQAIQDGFKDYALAHPKPSINTLGRWAASFFTKGFNPGRLDTSEYFDQQKNLFLLTEENNLSQVKKICQPRVAARFRQGRFNSASFPTVQNAN